MWTDHGWVPISYGERGAEAHEAGGMPVFARRGSEGTNEARTSSVRWDYSWR